MRRGLTVGLLALVTLERPLVHKLPGFSPEHTMVPVNEPPLLLLVDLVPFRADVSAAGETNLAPRLPRVTWLLVLVGCWAAGAR